MTLEDIKNTYQVIRQDLKLKDVSQTTPPAESVKKPNWLGRVVIVLQIIGSALAIAGFVKNRMDVILGGVVLISSSLLEKLIHILTDNNMNDLDVALQLFNTLKTDANTAISTGTIVVQPKKIENENKSKKQLTPQIDDTIEPSQLIQDKQRKNTNRKLNLDETEILKTPVTINSKTPKKFDTDKLIQDNIQKQNLVEQKIEQILNPYENDKSNIQNNDGLQTPKKAKNETPQKIDTGDLIKNNIAKRKLLSQQIDQLENQDDNEESNIQNNEGLKTPVTETEPTKKDTDQLIQENLQKQNLLAQKIESNINLNEEITTTE